MQTMRRVPIAFLFAAEAAEVKMKQDGHTPSRWEVRYGESALFDLARDVMSGIGRLERLQGLPVTFPEEPGNVPDCVHLRLIAGDWKMDQFISAVMLNNSY